jgi:phosphatidylinositol alpha-1,6-mannosyltransferase
VDKDIEGFGVALPEAQACGKAVVGGASGGPAGTRRAPGTGWVVPSEGPGELALLAEDLPSDRGRLIRMRQADWQRAVENFGWPGTFSAISRPVRLAHAARAFMDRGL